jgi:molybdopterin-containing oxidoreductase family membrane subunit
MTTRNPAELVARPYTYTALTRRTLSMTAGRYAPLWFVGLLFSGSLTLLMLVSITWLLLRGVGVWGVNIPAAWGFAITNFVWWIGIGHAGTLISAILLLMRQKWRNSINRFAEAMTLLAILMAGMFPLLHLGRIQRFYYLLPYPNTLDNWPQWRSPLVWDVIAVMTYGIVSVIFWYLGLVPDLATVRDFARRKPARFIAGILSLGWRGSAVQWRRYHAVYFILGALATPLVVSVHSIVSLDFAVAIVPGWHSTIFPPYFVAGAIFSGMAMVLTIAIPLRRAFSLHDLITPKHLDAMAKVTLTAALVVAYGYLMETFDEWYSADHHELVRLHERFLGPTAPIFYLMLACNVLAPQILWFRNARRSPIALFLLSIIINVGMWSERYDIVVTSLAHATHLDSARGSFTPTFWDWSLLLGSLGTFAFLFLIFIRVTPIIPIHEVRELLNPKSASRHARTQIPPLARDARPDTILARFQSPGAILEAARAVRPRHPGRVEAFTPFQVEHLPEVLGIPPSRIPSIMAAAAVASAAATYFLQYYAAVISYPWHIGGRPLHSWPSFIPLTFELGVLGGSLAGLAAFILANHFPKPYHPLARIATFARASADAFFLALTDVVDADRPELVALLQSHGAQRIDEVDTR